MIKLCIFDMDGLLIDSERAMWTPSQAQACLEQGFILTDELHATYMGMNFKDVGKVLSKAFPGIDFEKVYNRTLELNNIYIEKGLPLRKGALDLLHYLRSQGIKTCIGTSTKKINTERILEVINIRDLFDEVVCGDEVVNGKPDPEIYLKCFNKFNFKKEEVLIFEDADTGGQAALASGMRLILVPDLAYVGEDTKAKAYKVLNSLDEAIPIIKEENERTTCL